MRNKASSQSGNKSLRLVVWFLFALFVIVAISLSIKAVAIFRESIFDGEHRFTVFFTDGQQKAFIISLDPQGRSVFLRLSGKPSKKVAESALLVPFDGSMRTENEVAADSSVTALLSAFLFSPNAMYDSLTPYDLLRLYLISLQEQKEQIEETVTVDKGIAKIEASQRFFSDSGILSDDKTVAIVNGTGVSGLGQRVEQVFISLGASVVSVTTGRETQEPTHIFYSGNKSYTVERIERIFHQKAEEGNTQAADILVVVGRRSIPLGIFATLEQ